METKAKKIMGTVVVTALTMGVAVASAHAAAKPGCAVEKCYVIAKKAKNDCGTAKHACAGQAKTNNDPSDWIMVMKGNCNAITGGSLK